MIALYNFLPLFCPSCGTPTRLDRTDNPLSARYRAGQTLTCPICGAKYQQATKTDLLRAATASGGDMLNYFVGDESDKGTMN